MRITIEQYMMNIAEQTKLRSTCSRRRVGCVITDHENYILSTGYNGTPKGAKHCIDSPCGGAHFGSGEGLDVCEAIHAEINAITHCRALESASIIYCTTSPCMSCIKAISATHIRKVYYKEVYNIAPFEYFESIGGKIIKVS